MIAAASNARRGRQNASAPERKALAWGDHTTGDVWLADVRRQFGKQQRVVAGIDDTAKRSCTFPAGEAVALETAAVDQWPEASAEHLFRATAWARNNLRLRRRAGFAGKIRRCG